MIRILNKKTNHIFVLPDEEVMKIMKQDRTNEFQVLDAGFQVETEEVVPQTTVEELVMEAEQRKEEIEEEDKVPVEEVKKVRTNLPKITEDTLNLDKLKVKELIQICRRLNLHANTKETKQVLIDRIRKTGVLK